MYNWAEYRKQIQEQAAGMTSPTWRSDEKYVFEIIDFAESEQIEPVRAGQPIKLSNLRTILREAKKAIRNEDTDRFQELIDWASCLPVKDLRVKVGSANREEIHVKRDSHGKTSQYMMFLTQDQFKDISQMFRAKYIFTIDEIL